MHTPGTSFWGYFKGKLPALGAFFSLLPFPCLPIPLEPSWGASPRSLSQKGLETLGTH